MRKKGRPNIVKRDMVEYARSKCMSYKEASQFYSVKYNTMWRASNRFGIKLRGRNEKRLVQMEIDEELIEIMAKELYQISNYCNGQMRINAFNSYLKGRVFE